MERYFRELPPTGLIVYLKRLAVIERCDYTLRSLIKRHVRNRIRIFCPAGSASIAVFM